MDTNQIILFLIYFNESKWEKYEGLFWYFGGFYL